MGARLRSPSLDLERVRAQFPALSRRHRGHPVIYLDGPGGSQVPQAVIDAMTGYLSGSNANLGGEFASSAESVELYERARAAAADFTGSEPEEIAFGANMTTLNFLLAHAVARTLAAGDEIVVTDLDHDANVAPWLLVARDHGLEVRHAPIRRADATLDEDALEMLIGPRTRVVAFTLASNAVGSIPDAARVVEAAHAAGALAWADAVHMAPHRRLGRRSLDLDVLVCSPYKHFGPHQGVAAIRRELAEGLPADRVRPADEWPPGHRFETGTQSHEALAGTVAAIDYLAGLGEGADRTARLDTAFERIADHESALSLRFLEGLGSISGLTLHGVADPLRIGERTPTFCLNLDGFAPRELAATLAAEGIWAWHGHYYALAPMRALDLQPDGALRIGFLHYNTADEVDRTLAALGSLAAARR
jgi:cysteine desulfurase family protein (TIGR01976 family)